MNIEISENEPNKILEKLRDFFVSESWTILNDCTPDIAIDVGDPYAVMYPTGGVGDVPIMGGVSSGTISGTYSDGVILAAKRGDILIVMRSMNGLRVMKTQAKKPMTQILETNTRPRDGFLNPEYRGIMITACTGYTSNPPSGLWYDQANVLCNTNGDALGIFLPIPEVTAENNIPVSGNPTEAIEQKKDSLISQKLILNYNKSSNGTLILLTLECIYKKYGVQQGDEYDDKHIHTDEKTDIKIVRRYKHAAFGELEKVGNWNGGVFLSGTHNSLDIPKRTTVYATDPAGSNYVCYKWYDEIDNSGNPLFSMSDDQSTFCRIDCDGAPLRLVPVLWASAGPDTGFFYTGKILGLPIGTVGYVHEKYPHYQNIISQTPDDYGRNTNTLNEITVCLNLYVYIQRDPDSLMNFSQIGYIPSVFAISLKSMAPYMKYEFQYPNTGLKYQVFPHIEKKEDYGYDGIAVKQ